MPRLDGNESYYDGRLVDKETDSVVYFDDTHEYKAKSDGLQGVSVTTMIHSYVTPFDADFWSSYKALEAICEPEIFGIVKPKLLQTKRFNKALIDQLEIDSTLFKNKKQEILDSYTLENKKSCEYGTKIHAAIENALYGRDPATLKKYGLGGKMEVFRGKYTLDLGTGVYPEFMISYRDGDFLLCGQVDMLVIDGDNVIIIDHKTNKKIEFKSFYDKFKKSQTMLKYPLNNIQDCNGQHYTLQLSTYAWMIQQLNPRYNIQRLTIHWIDHDGKESFIDVPYLKQDVEKMLKDFKKKLKIQKALDRDKPYII